MLSLKGLRCCRVPSKAPSLDLAVLWCSCLHKPYQDRTAAIPYTERQDNEPHTYNIYVYIYPPHTYILTQCPIFNSNLTGERQQCLRSTRKCTACVLRLLGHGCRQQRTGCCCQRCGSCGQTVSSGCVCRCARENRSTHGTHWRWSPPFRRCGKSRSQVCLYSMTVM